MPVEDTISGGQGDVVAAEKEKVEEGVTEEVKEAVEEAVGEEVKAAEEPKRRMTKAEKKLLYTTTSFAEPLQTRRAVLKVRSHTLLISHLSSISFSYCRVISVCMFMKFERGFTAEI